MWTGLAEESFSTHWKRERRASRISRKDKICSSIS